MLRVPSTIVFDILGKLASSFSPILLFPIIRVYLIQNALAAVLVGVRILVTF